MENYYTYIQELKGYGKCYTHIHVSFYYQHMVVCFSKLIVQSQFLSEITQKQFFKINNNEWHFCFYYVAINV